MQHATQKCLMLKKRKNIRNNVDKKNRDKMIEFEIY